MDIRIENSRFTLIVGDDAVAKNLFLKSSGEDLLDHTEEVALFSLTENRPLQQ